MAASDWGGWGGMLGQGFSRPGSGAPQATGGGGGGMYGDENPYLKKRGEDITSQMTQNFNRNVMPRIGSQAMLAGGFGGSRQGVVEANAMNDLNQNIGASLTDMYSKGYQADQQYDIGRRAMDHRYDALDLDRWRAEQDNRYRGVDQERSLQNSMLQQNELGQRYGGDMQDRSLNYYDRFSKYANDYGGRGGTQYGAETRSDPWGGAAALAKGAGSMWERYQRSKAGNNRYGEDWDTGD